MSGATGASRASSTGLYSATKFEYASKREVREKAKCLIPELRLFAASGVAGRDVVSRFLKREATKIPGADRAIADALRILELTSQYDLRRTGKLEVVRGDVSEFRL